MQYVLKYKDLSNFLIILIPKRNLYGLKQQKMVPLFQSHCGQSAFDTMIVSNAEYNHFIFIIRALYNYTVEIFIFYLYTSFFILTSISRF